MSGIFFSSTKSLLHIFVVGVFGFIALVTILRVSGNRTLSKMNSFDFIITIALGSTFSSALVDKRTSLADAVFAFSILVGLQWAVTWLSVRYPAFERLVKSRPVLLFERGHFFRDQMRKSHVTEEEVLSGVREQGMDSMKDVEAVYLEGNGKIIATSRSKLN